MKTARQISIEGVSDTSYSRCLITIWVVSSGVERLTAAFPYYSQKSAINRSGVRISHGPFSAAYSMPSFCIFSMVFLRANDASASRRRRSNSLCCRRSRQRSRRRSSLDGGRPISRAGGARRREATHEALIDASRVVARPDARKSGVEKRLARDAAGRRSRARAHGRHTPTPSPRRVGAFDARIARWRRRDDRASVHRASASMTFVGAAIPSRSVALRRRAARFHSRRTRV